MRKYYLNLLSSILLIITGTCIPVYANAPTTELVNVAGGTDTMDNYIGKGKWTVVNVWSPTCTACVRELPHLEAFHKKHSDDITVIGLTIDFPSFSYGKIDIVRNFLKSTPINYPLFLADLDLTADVIGNRLVAIPLLAIFDPKGNVVARWPGYIDTAEIEDFMKNYKDYVPSDDISSGFK